MKNIILCIVCFCLFSVVMSGCGTINDLKTEGKNIVGMTNPWTDIDAGQAAKAAGFAFAVPENADKTNFRILKAKDLVEMNFIISNAKCTARTRPSENMEDISGMFYDWEMERKSTILGLSVNERFAKEGLKYISSFLWHDQKKGRTYSMSCVCDGSVNGQSCNTDMPKGISAAVFANAAE